MNPEPPAGPNPEPIGGGRGERDTPGGSPAGKALVSGVTLLNQSRRTNSTHQVGRVLNIHVITELESADE